MKTSTVKAQRPARPKAKRPALDVAGALDNIFPVRAGVEESNDAFWVDIELLEDNPSQPRGEISELSLSEMVESFDEFGQIAAVMARPHPTEPGRWQLAHGHRRRETVRMGANAGAILPDPQRYRGKLFIIERELTDVQMAGIALEENENRKDLSPIERAHGYLNLQKLTTQELIKRGEKPRSPDGLASWRQVGEETGIKWRQLHRVARLLELEPAAVKALEENRLNERHGRGLLELIDYPWAQRQLLDVVLKEGLDGSKTQQLGQEVLKFLREKAPTDDWRAIQQAVKTMLQKKLAASRQQALEENREKLAAGTSHLSSVPPVAGSQSTSGTSESTPPGESQSTPDTSTDNETSSADIAAVHLGPARKHLDSAATKIKSLRITPDYRRRLIDELDALDQLSRALRRELSQRD